MASGKRTRLSALERRNQLIDVGRTVFAEKGYEATSVEEVAERAGISKPLVYEHFGGKEGLYAVIVDRELEHLIARITAALDEGTPRERVEAATLALIGYARERPDGFAVLSHDAPTTQGLSNLLSEVASRVTDLLRTEFQRAGYRARLAPLYAQALVGMVSFAAQWWREQSSMSPEETASHVAALAWMGLRHLPKEPDRLRRRGA
jgi:AcrR family transcriptional regulator